MKKVLCTVACALLMFSCTQDDNLFVEENPVDVPIQVELTTAEAQTKFAKILSKAVAESEEVRQFIRKEALSRFDNDNDVFYPFVKDKIVPGTGAQTFRNILLSYCSEEELKAIEKSQPLLNILVPDLTLFWEFNAQNWDTSSNEVAVFCRNDETNSLYANGENIGQLPVGEVPGFPCLVIKNNERLRVNNAATRTVDGVGYEFISDAYDGSKHPQTRDSEFDQVVEPVPGESASWIQLNSDDPLVKAYYEFKDVPSACQRDYIYYGITKENKPGTLNKKIREKLYRFKINGTAFMVISDDEKDPELVESFSKKENYYTKEEILERIWTDGAFEIEFVSCVTVEGNKDGMEKKIHLSCKPSDLFALTQIHIHHNNKTWFHRATNTYTTDPDNLVSKWVYPEFIDTNKSHNLVFTNPWDLSQQSLSIHMAVYEVDAEGENTIQKTIVNEYANKADFSLDGGGDAGEINLSSKLGYGFSSTHSETSVMTYTRKVGSDDLGTLSFYFYDPVIVTSTGSNTYSLFSASSGDVMVTLLPTETSY